MTSAFDNNIPVSQPYYPSVKTGTEEVILYDKPLYNWMSLRSKGPNWLADTVLIGDTVQNGFVNSNDKVGTQPSGKNNNQNSNDQPWEIPPETAPQLIWDYNYRLVSIRDVLYPFAAVNFTPSYQVMTVNCQSAPEPIDVVNDASTAVLGTTQLECHLIFQGYQSLVQSGTAGSAFAATNPNSGPSNLGPEFLWDTGVIRIQPNFNKWAQIQYGFEISNVTLTFSPGAVAGSAPYSMPAVLNNYTLNFNGLNAPGVDPSNPQEDLDGTIDIALQVKSDVYVNPTTVAAESMIANAATGNTSATYFYSAKLDFILLCKDAAPANP